MNVNLQGNKRFITSVLKSDFLQEIIRDLVVTQPIENTFFVPLLDLSERELHYCDFSSVTPENIVHYLSASVAMPFYNKGVMINEKYFFDGAVVDNIPIYPVLSKNLDYVICIYFDEINYIFEDYNSDNKVIRLTFSDNKILSNSVCIQHDSIVKMIDEGYRHTKEILTFVFSEGFNDLDSIHEKIAMVNAKNMNDRSVRITGDVIVSNINKLTKKIVRHKKTEKGSNLYE